MECSLEQLSIWDIERTDKPREIINKVISVKFEKDAKPLELTELQQKFLDKNNVMKNENLYRLIKYCGGGLGIECIVLGGFKTIYVNEKGMEEFEINKRINVLPMDHIVYYKEDLKANSIQENKLKIIKEKYNNLKEIKRKGDENIIVEVPEKVISINSLGWVVEFNNVQAMYSENEVIQNKNEESQIMDIKKMQKCIKAGDKVRAYLSKEECVIGTVTREYGMGNEILNIIFEHEKTKFSTAIGRKQVIQLIS